MKFLLTTFYVLLTLLLPRVLFAFTALDLINRIGTYIINPMIYVLFSAAFIVFVWGLLQFVANLDNEEMRSTGIKHMIWGIVGMAVMAGVNGILAIICNVIGEIGGGCAIS